MVEDDTAPIVLWNSGVPMHTEGDPNLHPKTRAGLEWRLWPSHSYTGKTATTLVRAVEEVFGVYSSCMTLS